MRVAEGAAEGAGRPVANKVCDRDDIGVATAGEASILFAENDARVDIKGDGSIPVARHTVEMNEGK